MKIRISLGAAVLQLAIVPRERRSLKRATLLRHRLRPRRKLPFPTAGCCSLPARLTKKAMCCPRPAFQANRLVPGHGADHGRRRAGEAKGPSDPIFGMNLRQIPGVTYPIGANFSNIAMHPTVPSSVSWWYRKTVHAAGELQGKDDLAEFSRHQLPRQHLAERQADREIGRRRRRLAHLRVQRHRRRPSPARRMCWPSRSSRPRRHDLAITFVDWNPAPPDKNMGLVARGLSHHQRSRWRCAIPR